MIPHRVVFLGSDPIGLPLLHWLSANAEIVAVFTQPDRATGRGQRVTPNALKHWALDRGVPVLQPEKITDDVRAALAALRPDVALVMAYGHILRDDFIATPRLGTLNFHTSLLPKYRGASPIQSSIAAGERETGVTLMRIIRALDAGPVADVERVPIGPASTAEDIEAALALACVPLIARALPRLLGGTLEFREQDSAAATYCRRLEKADGVLDFAQSAATLAARINGLFPWPTCVVPIAGQSIRLGQAAAREGTGEPGVVLGADAEGVRVGTGRGVLELRRLQRPGGKMLPAAEFVRGFPLPAGTMLPSQPMPELVGTVPFRPAKRPDAGPAASPRR